MSLKNEVLVVSKHTLTAKDTRDAIQLRDTCNRVDGLDLKLDLGTVWAGPGTERDLSYFLSYAGETLTGYCALDGGTEVELCGMVHPEYRRQGIGQALLAAARTECARRQVETLLLICEEASRAGQAFTMANGGQRTFAEHHMELGTLQRRPVRDQRLRLEPAGVGDIEVLARVIAAAFGDLVEATRQRVTLEIISRGPQYYLARLEQEPIGTLKVYRDGDRASIYTFGVLPEYRGRGYGRQILTETASMLLDEGRGHIGLEVETENSVALGLYLSCGFRVTTTYGYYRLDPGNAPRSM